MLSTPPSASPVESPTTPPPIFSGQFEWVGGRHTGEVFYDTTLGETVDERTVTYAHWSEGEPNDASGGEDCVQLMVGTGTLSSFWSDENCYKPNEFFIVEFDA